MPSTGPVPPSARAGATSEPKATLAWTGYTTKGRTRSFENLLKDYNIIDNILNLALGARHI